MCSQTSVSLSLTLAHTLSVALVDGVNLLVVVSEADPLTDHISDRSLVSSCGRKSLVFMSLIGLSGQNNGRRLAIMFSFPILI